MHKDPSLPKGLAPVREAQRFDEAALGRYLSDKLPGFGPDLKIHQFKGGQSNPTFHLATAGGKDYVLRKRPKGKLLPSAHAVDREFRVLKALQGSAVPVPEMVHFCDDDRVIGTDFYLMDYLPGRILRDPLLPGMGVDERQAIYQSMNDTLAALHNVDWQAAGLAGYGRTGGYIARQIALWTRQYQASKTTEVPAMDKLMAWLPDNIPAEGTTSIAHGDFRIENLMFHETEPRVIAVLDWELSTLGHPLSDLAFNCMTYHLPSDNDIAKGFDGVDIAALGIPSEEDYVAAYCKNTGREGIENWNFYLAFSLFRTAAIQQGIYARALKGNASSDIAHMFGKIFSHVAAQGWAVIESSD